MNEQFLHLSSFPTFSSSSEVGKGWFSIHETNPDTYRQAALNAWESYGLFHLFCLNVCKYNSSSRARCESFCPSSGLSCRQEEMGLAETKVILTVVIVYFGKVCIECQNGRAIRSGRIHCGILHWTPSLATAKAWRGKMAKCSFLSLLA